MKIRNISSCVTIIDTVIPPTTTATITSTSKTSTATKEITLKSNQDETLKKTDDVSCCTQLMPMSFILVALLMSEYIRGVLLD